MEKINKNIIIASFIKQTNKDNININELLNYSKEVSKRLKAKGYYVEHLDYQGVINFFKYFIMFGKIDTKNNIIELNNNINKESKLDKFFLSNLSQDIILLLKKDEEFIFPIVKNNELIKYYISLKYFDLLDDIKNNFYNTQENEYIFDLNILKEKNVNIIEFLNKFINNSKLINKEIVNCNTILEFSDYADYLSVLKFKQIQDSFNISDELSRLKLVSDILLNYYNIGNCNQLILSELEEKYKILSLR